jgi:deazaflavin-dependent oxidoreductase (nitroreductase family)
MRMQWRLHRLVWRLSGGRLGRRVLGMPVLELVTVGHRSGQQRRVLLSYVPTESGPALAGSNAGAQQDPAWARNLRARPEARVREAGEWRDVRARFLDGEEYQQVWELFAAASDAYPSYRQITGRPIPLVVLEAVG